MIEQLREAFCSAAAKPGCEIPEMDGEAEHVHLLVAYPPKLAVSVMVNHGNWRLQIENRPGSSCCCRTPRRIGML